MNPSIEVETQGISDDWQHADGDFTVKPRGMLTADQLKSAMLHLAPLDTPNGDDVCPPQVMTRGAAGSFGFIGQGGSIFCPDTDADLTASQAMGMAFGTVPLAPPPPMPASKTRKAPVAAAPAPLRQRKKFGWRSWIVAILATCFILGAVTMAFGVSSMRARGVVGDDVLAAITIGIALGVIGILMFLLAFKARRTEYFDGQGTRVKEDGSALPFVVMGQSLGDYDDGDDGFDGDFD